MKLDPVLKFLLALGCAAALLIASFILLLDWGFEQTRKERFPAWVKLTGRNDMSYEEWAKLDRAGYFTGGKR